MKPCSSSQPTTAGTDHSRIQPARRYDHPVDRLRPGISGGAVITQIHTMDTAATAAFALGLPLPAEWDGVPVYGAFGLTAPAKQSKNCK